MKDNQSLNHFNCTAAMEDSITVTMEVGPEMAALMKGEPMFLEIEMLQGETRQMEDGRTHYKFEVGDPIKVAMVRDFMRMLMLSERVTTDN